MHVNPSHNGWLSDYLEYRKSIFQSFLEDTANDSHPEQSMYRILQPSGIMYGHPLNKSNVVDTTNLDKLKLLMAESLISGSLIYHHQEINNEDDFSDVIMRTVHKIGDFYNKIYPELSVSKHTFLGKKKSPLEIAEKILEKRVYKTSKKQVNYWISFFDNIILFLDIYFFGQWMHTSSEKMIAEFFQQEKEELRFSIIKVMSAAAHANKNIEEEEQALFNFFLKSSHLSAAQKAEAKKDFKRGISLADIYIPNQNSWLLKKFFLELAILTVWVDRKLEDSEMVFLKAFSKKMGFYEEDLENSLLAVEGFILENWDMLSHLRSGHVLDEISTEYLKRVKSTTDRNAIRINNELKNNTNLSRLLLKSKSEELSKEEEKQLHDGLINVLKAVPTFVIIGLPVSYLTLPMLLKILPNE
jgi:23S rRNA pseudoU1915 N3-methylase RlmH